MGERPTTSAMGRVLVIEDDPAVRHILRVVLEQAGHEVIDADDGSRGLALAQRRSPGVIILDVMMPFMDGFAVLEALREDERTVSIPVLMLSAMQHEPVEEQCYRLGAKAYIRKPFDQGMLLGTIEELLSAPPELAVEAVERQVREVPLAVTLAWRDGA
jgi:DNA-binding response OmpR family regulator